MLQEMTSQEVMSQEVTILPVRSLPATPVRLARLKRAVTSVAEIVGEKSPR